MDIAMFDGIGAGNRLGKVRELMQLGDLDGALAEVDQLIVLGVSLSDAWQLKPQILEMMVSVKTMQAVGSLEANANRDLEDFSTNANLLNEIFEPNEAEVQLQLGNQFYEAGDL